MTVNEQGSVSYGVAAANMPFGGGEKDLRVDCPFLFFYRRHENRRCDVYGSGL